MANEGSATSLASADNETGVHRLRDIVVEEVSLVDRAANKRRFLVVKRSNAMADPDNPKARRVSPHGQADAAQHGSRSTKPDVENDVGKARPRVTRPAPDEDEDAEKARRPPSSERGNDEDAMSARKATASNRVDDEDPESDDDEEEDEGEGAGNNVVKGEERAEDAEDDEDDDDENADDDDENAEADKKRRRAKVEGDVSGTTRQPRSGKPTRKVEDDALVLSAEVKNTVLRVLAQVLERLMAVANQVKEADEPGDSSDANTPDDLIGELEDIGELLEDIGEQLAATTEKAIGKKPGTMGRATSTGGTGAVRANRPAVKPDAAKTEVPKADVAKAGRRMAKERLDRFRKALELLSSVLQELTEAKETPAPSAGSAEKSVAKRDASPAMHELFASVQDLTRIVQRQEEQLVRLQKTRATSNAIPIEGGSRRREIQEVSWPLDMNRPISRETVAKSVSFYDEE